VERFQNDTVSLAVYTAKPIRFENGCVFWREIWLAGANTEVNMVSLARSGALVFTFAALISGLSSLYQLSSLLLPLNHEAYRNSRQNCVQMLTFSQPLRETKRKANADSGFGLGELLFWWNNSLHGVMLPEE